MRRLTDVERVALNQYGEPGEGPVPDSVFAELEALGWGYWREGFWWVTESGRLALSLDTIARERA